MWVFLWAWLGILQIVLLPGLVIWAIQKKYHNAALWGRLPALLWIICLSLLLNGIIQAIFTIISLGAYSALVWRSIVFIELIVLTYLWSQSSQTLLQWFDFSSITMPLSRYFYGANINQKIIRLVALLLLLLMIGGLLYIGINQLNSPFDQWDALQSWNPWALSLAHQKWPATEGFYPPLVPLLWSIIYNIQGVDAQKLELLVRNVQFVWPAILTIVSIILFLKRPAFKIVIASIISLGFILLHYGNLVGIGTVDFAVMTLASVAMAAVLIPESQRSHTVLWLWLGTITVILAAVTKQAGMYLLLTYPLIVLRAWYQQQKRTSLTFKKWLLYYIIIAVVFVLPWYAFAFYRIEFLNAVTAVPVATHLVYQWLNANDTMSFRIIHGIMVAGGYWFLLAFAVYQTIKQHHKWLAVWLLLFTLIWWALFSYDSRNLILIVGVTGFWAGLGICTFFRSHQNWFSDTWSDISKLRLCWWPFIIVGILASMSVLKTWHYQPMLKRQNSAIMHKVGNPQINAVLLALKHYGVLNDGILSTWQYVQHVPQLSMLYHTAYTQVGQNQYPVMADFQQILLQAKNKHINWLLVPEQSPLSTQRFREQLKLAIHHHQWQVIYKNKHAGLYYKR